MKIMEDPYPETPGEMGRGAVAALTRKIQIKNVPIGKQVAA